MAQERSEGGSRDPALKHDAATTTEADLNAAEKACIHDDLSRFDSPNTTLGQQMEGLDRFYADYRNKNIHITDALVYVNEEISGKPQSVLNAHVREMCQQAANQ